MGIVIEGKFEHRRPGVKLASLKAKRVLLVRAIDMLLVYSRVIPDAKKADILREKILKAVNAAQPVVVFTPAECARLPEVLGDPLKACELYRILYVDKIN